MQKVPGDGIQSLTLGKSVCSWTLGSYIRCGGWAIKTLSLWSLLTLEVQWFCYYLQKTKSAKGCLKSASPGSRLWDGDYHARSVCESSLRTNACGGERKGRKQDWKEGDIGLRYILNKGLIPSNKALKLGWSLRFSQVGIGNGDGCLYSTLTRHQMQAAERQEYNISYGNYINLGQSLRRADRQRHS